MMGMILQGTGGRGGYALERGPNVKARMRSGCNPIRERRPSTSREAEARYIGRSPGIVGEAPAKSLSSNWNCTAIL